MSENVRAGAAGPGPGRLGAALRRWRDRVAPGEVGLPAGRRRRAGGLRREELAQLAGMSADYIVRLEQGRATSPSPQILTALARALRLSAEERGHLFHLAGRFDPGAERAPDRPAPGVARLLDRMADSPVGVYDAAWSLVAWNRPFAALMGDPSGLTGLERNVVWRHFTGRATRVRHTGDQRVRFEAAVVADLRGAAARYPRDERLQSLAADLYKASPRFAALWDSGEVGEHPSSSKVVHHPDAGPVELDCDVLAAPSGGQHIVVYTAEPGTEAARRLRLLGVAAPDSGTGSGPEPVPWPPGADDPPQQ
ncbi:helix-turn-helix transcriptional regulator [Streptomonospora sediminis]